MAFAIGVLASAICVSAQTAQTFASPDDAVKGLIAAARSHDRDGAAVSAVNYAEGVRQFQPRLVSTLGSWCGS